MKNGMTLMPGNFRVSGEYARGVDVSDDGNTIVSITYTDSSYLVGGGLVHVYKYLNGTWTYSKKLYTKGTLGSYYASVDISADGSTIAIGGASTQSQYVFLYQKKEEEWYEVAIVKTSDWVTGYSFGKAVALNQDGTMLMATAPYANSNKGAAYFFM